MQRILCLNGPNLDRLGTRQPEVYGATTLSDLETMVSAWGSKLNLEVDCFQSNSETELIAAIHGSTRYDGVILNPGAFTHYSHALGDAIGSVETPVVEVHISNVRQRDRWRRRSVVSARTSFTIFGRGLTGYRDGLRHLANLSQWPVETERYGPHPDQVIDFRLSEERRGKAILVHGGFYMDAWGRDSLESWAVDLARSGWSSALVEYRRHPSGGNPVATTADIAEAIDVAQRRLGTGPTVVIGHSSGAHLAIWNEVTRPQTTELTIGVSGFFDLRSNGALGDGAVDRFDPDGSLDLMTAPLPEGEVVFVHGSDDQVVPASRSMEYHRKITDAGNASSLDVVDGAGHFDLLAAPSDGWRLITAHLGKLAGV